MQVLFKLINGTIQCVYFYIGINLLFALTSTLEPGYCPGDDEGDLKCCINYRKEDNKCVECEIGSYGNNCSKTCPPGLYGRYCIKRCSCHPELCNHATGCNNTVGSVEEDTVSSATTSKTSTFKISVESYIAQNITLRCPLSGVVSFWWHQIGINKDTARVFSTQSVILQNISYEDRGHYLCFIKMVSCSNSTEIEIVYRTVYLKIQGPPSVISSTEQNSYTDGKIKILKLKLISHPPPENIVSVEPTNAMDGKMTFAVSLAAALVPINVYGRQYSVPGYAAQIELRALDISWTGIYNIAFVNIFGRSVHHVFLREIVDETNTTPSSNITQISSAEDMASGLEKFLSKYWVFMAVCAGGSVATCFTIAISMQIRKCVKIKNVQVYSAPIPNNMELRDVKEERQYDAIIDDCVGTSNDTIDDEDHYNIIEYGSSSSSYEQPV